MRKGSEQYADTNRQIRALRKDIEARFRAVEGVLTSDIADQILSGTYIPENQRTRDTAFVSYARMVNRLLYENGHFGHDTMRNKECCIRAFEKYESEVLRS